MDRNLIVSLVLELYRIKFMKKILLFVAIILSGVFFNKATAQDATLNVSLAAIQSIKINNPIVNIAFTTASDYTDGKSSGAIADQIEILSTGLFTVSVKASGDLAGGASTTAIPLAALTLTPSLSSSATTLAGQTYNVMAGNLAVTDKPFIKASSGTSNAKFSVNYGISPGVGGAYLLNRSAGSYTTTLTYTIAAN